MTEATKQLSESDLKKLLELYNTARTTPVISLTGKAEDDWSKLAWDSVREFQQELGKKYDYDWEKTGIDGKGEIKPI